MRATILITGFGPFPGAPYNPTVALVEQLGQLKRPALADVKIVSHIFETSYAAVDRDLAFVGLILPSDHAEQRGLAGAVRADEADLVALLNRGRRLDEQDLVAVLLDDVVETDHAGWWDFAGRWARVRRPYAMQRRK